MARDPGLEALVEDELKFEPNVVAQAMFGGWAWLLDGHLLCAARDDGMLVRLGKGNDGWALKHPGIVRMISRGRPMLGWVRAAPDAYGNDALRRSLIDAALTFVRSLPPK
ncbi:MULTISPECIES: TfoX/Sxy family protein [unclassified Burkholderia]|uniref:TfoX/Sxy family protein n=1 Tax=unclassified Burkholderia TaxID=2613784 RepID=UPI000757C791|nr:MULTISPECIES: TfoX/Sxy family protein [unclassified Burkholderia]KVN00724.1 cold-shock protein [Burkholderia sp. MSMB1552]KWZ55251.1 cold-shock protein [Burkholderia sp. MSMB1588]